MNKKVFNIKQALILYIVVIVCFYFSSLVFSKKFGIIGIPLTHLIVLLAPGALIAIFMEKNLIDLYFLRLPSKTKYLFIGIGLWILAIIFSGIFAFFALKYLPEETKLIKAFDYIFSNTSLTSQLIIISIIPAVIEELLFRGLFLSSFLNNTTPFKSIVATSLMFAAMHFSLIKLVPTFLLGAVFGYVVYKSQSILIAIVLHFINNSMSILGTHLLSDLPVNLNKLFIFNEYSIFSLIYSLILILILSIRLTYRGKYHV